MSVAEVNALLYSSHHPRDQLERALRIPALSPGWRWSFEALVESQDAHPGATGNAGLAPEAAAQAAAPGFRPLRVSRIDRECVDVISLTLQPADGRRLTTPLPGQFVVLRLRPKPDGPSTLPELFTLRSPLRHAVSRQRQGGAERRRGERTSDSNVRAGRCHRCQRAERQLHPAAGRRAGGAPERGNRRDARARDAACPGRERIASGGLVAARCTQQQVAVFRHGGATASREACRGRRQIWYSQPAPEDRHGQDYDATGRVGMKAFEQLGVPRGATSIFAGHRASWAISEAGLAALGRLRGADPFRASFPAALRGRPAWWAPRPGAPHQPAGVSRNGAAGVLRAERAHRSLAPGGPEPPRARGGVRRARALVVPDRRLPQLRERTDLRAVVTSPTRSIHPRGQRPHLLLPAEGDVVIDL